MRLVFAIAEHLHMTAGAVLDSMGAHELMCWAHLLGQRMPKVDKPPEPEPPRVLDVEDEIAAWGE